MPFYLTSEKARSLLVERGIFTNENAPSVDYINSVNSYLQEIVDGWLGYNALPQSYTEKHDSNNSGIVTLTQHPVISIEKIVILYNSTTQPYSFSEIDIKTAWRFRDRRIYTNLSVSRLVEIEYTAGYIPTPAVFETSIFGLLKTALQNADPWDATFLYQPTKDVTSVSLAGLSQGFKLGEVKDARVIDRLLQPLQKYRRRIIGC